MFVTRFWYVFDYVMVKLELSALPWCVRQRGTRPWSCCNICVLTIWTFLSDTSSTLACWTRGAGMRTTAAWFDSARTGGWFRLRQSSERSRISLITLAYPPCSFFIVSPTDQQVHCWSWMKKHMPNDPHLHLEDVSWKYTGKWTLRLSSSAVRFY